MTSTATIAQQSKIYISGTPGASIPITAITKAAQAVVSATNTLKQGDVVVFGDITNMPEIKGLLGIVQSGPTGTSFTVAIDSSGFATAGTTGTCTPQTFSKVGNVQDFTPDGGSVNIIDVSNTDSTAKEKRAGLQDNGNATLTFHADDADAGQLALQAARTAQALVVVKQVLPGSMKIRAFNAIVNKLAEPTVGVDKVLTSSASLTLSGPIFRG